VILGLAMIILGQISHRVGFLLIITSVSNSSIPLAPLIRESGSQSSQEMFREADHGYESSYLIPQSLLTYCVVLHTLC